VNQIEQVVAPAPVYRGFAPRPTMPDIKLFHGYMAVVPEVDRPDFAALERRLDEPFVGITADGAVRAGLYDIDEPGAAGAAVVDAARAFLDSLASADQRFGALQPLDSLHRRRWTNAFATWLPPGLLLDDLGPGQREAAIRVVAASLSAAGLDETRKVMKLNEALGDLIGLYQDTLREWVYFFTIFGEPSEHEPWGWQLMGHHLVLNGFVLGDQVIVSPVFMGAEMVELDEGRFVGIKAFVDEHERGVDVIRSLSPAQQEHAILYRSMRSTDLPPELAGRVEGRHRGGAGRDNLVLPYEGVAARDLDAAQRERLVALLETYLGRNAQARADLTRAKRHLDETFFAWIGDPEEDGPFYYRVHSPVVLIEFDHHAGIFLTAEEPQPFHVHTIVRMPNGGDYGMSLLAQHRGTREGG
jgi:Protein of unknown function (DUF3500)